MSNEVKSVRMWIEENLEAVGHTDRRPIADLIADEHIHGGLRLEIGGRLVPHLGYFGPDDVCFGQLLVELDHAACALQQPNGRYIYDEGEQGQPAFLFERDSNHGYFSIIQSELSGADGDEDWQRVEFSPSEFATGFQQLVTSFTSELRAGVPAVAEAWLAHTFPKWFDSLSSLSSNHNH